VHWRGWGPNEFAKGRGEGSSKFYIKILRPYLLRKRPHPHTPTPNHTPTCSLLGMGRGAPKEAGVRLVGIGRDRVGPTHSHMQGMADRAKVPLGEGPRLRDQTTMVASAGSATHRAPLGLARSADTGPLDRVRPSPSPASPERCLGVFLP